MGEMINWAEMPDKEKVRLLLDKVMGYFVLEETATGYRTPDLPSHLPGFHWPIAFWNTDGECWAYKGIDDNSVTFFNPLHDMNDACLVIEHIDETLTLIFSPRRQTDTVCNAFYECKINDYDPYTSHEWRAYAETAPEAICLAVLRKRGYHIIQVLKEALPAWQVTRDDGKQHVFQTREQAEEEYNNRMKYLKEHLRWAKDSRKVRIDEIKVPEDYWNGGLEWA